MAKNRNSNSCWRQRAHIEKIFLYVQFVNTFCSVFLLLIQYIRIFFVFFLEYLKEYEESYGLKMLQTSKKTSASDQVRGYLGTLGSYTSEERIRLPSIRQLATHLGVSASTVAGVYRELKENGALETSAGGGSYLKKSTQERFQVPIRLTVNLTSKDVQQLGSWSSLIMGGLTVAAMSSGLRLTFQTVETVLGHPVPVTPTSHDAVLLMPSGTYREDLIAWAQKHTLPIVYLTPPTDNATENFVSADYFGASMRVGQAFRASGRKRVLFVNDRAYDASTSNRLRVSGMLAGLKYGSDASMEFDMLFTQGEVSAEAARRFLSCYLEKKRCYPDAIYTPGDFLAIGCLTELESRGVRCPEEVSVVGGTGLALDRSPYPQLTRTSHLYEKLGQEMIAAIKAQITYPEHPTPGKIVDMGWLGGATTTDVENEILFQDSASNAPP